MTLGSTHGQVEEILNRAVGWMSHRKWKETKQDPSMLPGPAVPGSCLASFHFRWAIHPIPPVGSQLCSCLSFVADVESEESPKGETGDEMAVGVRPVRRHLHLQQQSREGQEGLQDRRAAASEFR